MVSSELGVEQGELQSHLWKVKGKSIACDDARLLGACEVLGMNAENLRNDSKKHQTRWFVIQRMRTIARATKRDFAAVEECLQTDVALALRILPMRGIIPKKLGKKMSELERNRKKVHVLNYELALVRRGRGGKRPSAMATDAPKGGDGGGDDE